MSNQHRIIPCRIWIKSFEWQLFMAEVFQSPVCQLVTAAFMVAGHNGLRFQIAFSAGFDKHFIDWLPLANIGNDHRIGSTAGKIKLIAIVEQSAVKGTPE